MGTDSIETPSRRELHVGGPHVPVDPEGLTSRLAAAGFVGLVVKEVEDRFRFLATTRADRADRLGGSPPAAPGGHPHVSTDVPPRCRQVGSGQGLFQVGIGDAAFL